MGSVAVPAILTIQQNNDNVPDPVKLDNNIVLPFKVFDHNDYIDIEFTVTASDGVTEYRVLESVDNNTGVNWTSYKMQLGTGVNAAFTLSPAGDGLDFDSPDFDTPPVSAAFPLVALGEDTLTFMNGLQSSGAKSYLVRIDVPDGLQTFTLRQFPVPLGGDIPEPTTAVLAALSLIGLAVRRLRS